MASHRVELKATELTKPNSGSNDSLMATELEENLYKLLIFLFQHCNFESLLDEKRSVLVYTGFAMLAVFVGIGKSATHSKGLADSGWEHALARSKNLGPRKKRDDAFRNPVKAPSDSFGGLVTQTVTALLALGRWPSCTSLG